MAVLCTAEFLAEAGGLLVGATGSSRTACRGDAVPTSGPEHSLKATTGLAEHSRYPIAGVERSRRKRSRSTFSLGGISALPIGLTSTLLDSFSTGLAAGLCGLTSTLLGRELGVQASTRSAGLQVGKIL